MRGCIDTRNGPQHNSPKTIYKERQPSYHTGRAINVSHPVENGSPVPRTDTNINAPHNNCGVFANIDAALCMVNSRDFWDLYKINKSRADGHCILYSIISSLRSQHGIIVTKSFLQEQIVEECIKNKHIYEYIFLSDGSSVDFATLVYAYVYGKTYGTLFVDILPEIIARRLSMYVIVLYKHTGQFKYHLCPLISPAQNDKAVFLIKEGDHYNGLECVKTPL